MYAWFHDVLSDLGHLQSRTGRPCRSSTMAWCLCWHLHVRRLTACILHMTCAAVMPRPWAWPGLGRLSFTGPTGTRRRCLASGTRGGLCPRNHGIMLSWILALCSQNPHNYYALARGDIHVHIHFVVLMGPQS